MDHLLTQYKFICLQFRGFKGGLKVRTENICASEFCLPVDVTALNCGYTEVSLCFVFITHKQLPRGEVYSYLLKEWAWPIL